MGKVVLPETIDCILTVIQKFNPGGIKAFHFYPDGNVLVSGFTSDESKKIEEECGQGFLVHNGIPYKEAVRDEELSSHSFGEARVNFYGLCNSTPSQTLFFLKSPLKKTS